MIFHDDERFTLHLGDALEVAHTLATGSVQSIVTSPPYYGLRDYGQDGQIGAEGSLGEYVSNLVALFGELSRVLADDGTLWLNLGDSYASSGGHSAQGVTSSRKNRTNISAQNASKVITDLPAKNLLGVPWRVAFALQDAGWILRSDIIWAKKNVMPESVTDRPTKAHEYLFLLTKSPKYYYDAEAIQEDADPSSAARYESSFGNGKQEDLAATKYGKTIPTGTREFTGKRNKRTVWTVATSPFPGAHFAVYPPELIRPCILAGSRPGDIVLDPFSGSGTTGKVALDHGRKYVGIDLSEDYLKLSLRTRFAHQPMNIWGDER